MSRWVSFVVLAGIVVVCGFLFYQVMSQFLLPLFLAMILVVMFYPLQARLVTAFGGRERLAALVTTGIIMTIVLLPFALILSMAAAEGVSLATRLAQPETLIDLQRFRNRVGLAWPSKDVRNTNELVKARLAKWDDLAAAIESGINPDAKPALQRLVREARQEMGNLSRDLAKDRLADVESGLWREDQDLAWVEERLEATRMLQDLQDEIAVLDERIHEETPAAETPSAGPPVSSPTEPAPPDPGAPPPNFQPTPPVEKVQPPPAVDEAAPAASTDGSALDVDSGDGSSSTGDPLAGESSDSEAPAAAPTGTTEEQPDFFNTLLKDLAGRVTGADGAAISALPPALDKDLTARLTSFLAKYEEFERMLLGPSWIFGAKTLANPDEETTRVMLSTVQEWVTPVAKGTAGVLVNLLIGLVVMIVGLYYFLADGKAMVAALMKLSPIDDRHEAALLAQFEKISRAVVTATLVTAVVQGLLAGLGYYFAGLRQQAFLLTLVTMLTAMIPFVGAAAVWAACALYLLLVDNDPRAAIGLALWGGLVVSMVDNLVKPLILHGQSNLHPLLALLSVVGGVTALGPIGIFVGPMVVAFLQALLNILHNELIDLDKESQASSLLSSRALAFAGGDPAPEPVKASAATPSPSNHIPPHAAQPSTSIKKNRRAKRNKR